MKYMKHLVTKMLFITSPKVRQWISFQQFLKPKMNTLTVILVVTGLALTQARPGILDGISNFLTSVTSVLGGGKSAGEVEDYENAPYEVNQTYDVSL